ncbi:MAG: glutaredoxin 3 [Pseudomonadota bacterium]
MDSFDTQNTSMQNSAAPNVLMYATGTCPYCINAERLLTEKGVKIDKIRVDLQPELRHEMMQKTGRRTVPQIYINHQHIGGYDDLRALDVAGKLDSLLNI